ncbi:HD domain-containing protein [Rhizobium leguminosarum]|uniref:HD domain-containing protein n=1 Tax=Rhizobium leguminosarum TaxID=384 RepID=UPI00143FAAAB|nr:HD domain-containing protein [Rhizobium leguminosarum]NKL23488.1 HD domain-containing protein [Rhizobium leguminosarum bv. viciae]
MGRPKFFRDPVHLQIRFDPVDLTIPIGRLDKKSQISWVLQKLIDSEEFQRLRLIRQNGLANLVFHGAEHSRFSHSLGVQHVARVMFEKICRNRDISEDNDVKLEVLVSSLIHDVGHGAFSHTMEEILKENKVKFHHEEMTKKFILSDESSINRILSEIDGRLPDMIASFFDKKMRVEDHWKYKIVSSQMDADRLDYVQRDASFAGLRGHGFDFERLVDLLDVHEGKSIAINRGAIEAVEAYLVTIDQLYRAIYNHQAVRAATQMLLSLFRRAVNLWKDGNAAVFPNIGNVPHPIIELFEKGADVGVAAYGRLSDATIWALIEYWRYSEDLVLSDLSKRLMRRDLLKAYDLGEMSYVKWTDQKDKALELTAKIVGHEIAPYYVALDEPSRTSYKGYDFNPDSPDESIWLTGAGKRDRPLEDDPDSVIVKALRGKTYFPRLIVLSDVREKLIES